MRLHLYPFYYVGVVLCVAMCVVMCVQISLYRSADQLVSALTGRTLSVAASTGKLPELKQLWFTCVELLRNLWLSLLVNNPVPG